MTGSRVDCVGCREVPPATQARDPFAEHGVRFCLLCCQPKPFPLSLSARTLKPTLRRPCRPRPRNGTSYQRTHCRFATGTPTLHRSARTRVTGPRYKPRLLNVVRLESSKHIVLLRYLVLCQAALLIIHAGVSRRSQECKTTTTPEQAAASWRH